MRVLLLAKSSPYQVFFRNPRNLRKYERIRAPEIGRFHGAHARHSRAVEAVERFLKKEGVLFRKVHRRQKVDFEKFDLIITVGGDGTFLDAARRVSRQMILGVNSDPKWSVGRMCRADARTFAPILKKVFAGKGKVRSVHRIRLRLPAHHKDVDVLNDILICHQNPAAMSRYYLAAGGRAEEQRSSGIWIATAIGSTGAIRSAGGRVMAPGSRKMQFVARELYTGWKRKQVMQKGIVTPPERIQVRSLMQDGVIYVDGSHVSYPFYFGEVCQVFHSPSPLKVVWP